jgi:hypothetical protein
MPLEGELDVEVGLSDKELPLLIVAAGAELPSCAELGLCVPLPPLSVVGGLVESLVAVVDLDDGVLVVCDEDRLGDSELELGPPLEN